MDHCCDSITSYLITGSIGSIFGCSQLWHYTLLWLMASFPFFAVVWEENINRFFYLPPINGVAEGTLIVSIVLHTSAIIGLEEVFGRKLTLFGIERELKDFIVVVFFCFGVIICANV